MLPNDLINRFTTHLKETLQKALSFAVSNGREIVEPGDLLVGLMHEKGALGGEILMKAKCSVDDAVDFFRGSPKQKKSVMALDLSPQVKKIVEKCVIIAHLREHRFIGTEHLLAAILEADDPQIIAFFDKHQISIKHLKDQVESLLKSQTQFPNMEQMENRAQDGLDPQNPMMPDMDFPSLGPPLGGMHAPSSGSVLDSFSRDLTHADIAQLLDPVIGRDHELDRVIEVLIRRTKSNPILLGEPGVGKTAIVEGLAQRIANGDVPDALHGYKLLSLDLASTVAGTMYRGEFEARLKQIVEEAKAQPNVILFIDEIHNIVGAGSTSGSLDAANILKPALARGEIRCIGATTWSEYKKHIEPDAALERRFQPIVIDEPTPLATLEMLKGLADRYAEHHQVKFQPETLMAAVDFGDRFITDRLFPDKAVDLLDEAAASVVAQRKSKETLERLSVLDAAIQANLQTSEQLLKEQKLNQAEEKAQETEKLIKEKKRIETRMKRSAKRRTPEITPEDVAKVVARISHVPLSTILASERERLAGLEQGISKQIVGQSGAVEAVSDILRRARLGLQATRRPKASMLFVGPSGTGKTEMARVIADELFMNDDALIKIDMSEFSEPHSISKLVGSPAGYVGYRESNKLSDAIRKRPHAVVCFDEIEKAHPDVQHTLLQILEDGKLTDATGRAVSFAQSYVVLTSNVGSDQLGRKQLGFDQAKTALDPVIATELKERFKPELLNRLDRVVVFQPLLNEHLRSILDRELEDVCARLKKMQDVACEIPDSVRNWLMQQELPAEEGARAVRRLVEREITAAISKALIAHQKKKQLKFETDQEKLFVI